MAVSTIARSGLSTFDKFQRTSAGASTTPGLFVAVGQANIITSSDGITWTNRSTSASQLALVNRDSTSGAWYAFANDFTASTNKQWFSADGTTWAAENWPPNNLAGSNSYYTEDRQFAWYSTSGSQAGIANLRFSGTSSGTTWVNNPPAGFRNRYMMFNAGVVATSTNGGASWTDGVVTASSGWVTENIWLIHNGGTISSSTNGTSWTTRLSGTGWSSARFRRANGILFFFDSGNSRTTLYTSPDGITWTARTIPSMAVQDVTYGNGRYVIVGYSGALATSDDAITWTARTVTPTILWGVHFA